MDLIRKLLSRQNLVGLVLVCALFVAGGLVSELPGMRKLELSFVDARYRRHADNFATAESPIVIVDIGDNTYDALQTVWPFPRSYYAKLIRNLNRAGARLIGIDIMLDNAREDHPAGDDSLSKVLVEYDNVVLAAKAEFYGGNLVRGVALPHRKFLDSANANWALINTVEDIDGVVREYHEGLYHTYDSTMLLTMASELHRRASGKEFGDHLGLFKIAYPGGKKSFYYVPFYQVLDDADLWTKDEKEWGEQDNYFDTLMADAILKDKIVLVGSSMLELHDFIVTPFSTIAHEDKSEEVPGVEVHAAALHTLLNGYHIRDADRDLVVAVLLGACVLLLILGVLTPIWVYLPVIGLTSFAWAFVSYKIFALFSVLIPIATPILSMVLVSAGQQGFLFYLEQRRRRQVTGMFGQYVPKQVVRELIRDPEKMKLGGERRELSVLFSDVEGFTTISEKLTPEQLVELLNEYLTAMTEIVHQNGGIIDKYEGDAIMAEFGIPLVLPDHAVRACGTAFSMRKRLHELHDKWRQEGKPELNARVGIGSGQMVFGNMGSDQSFDYTVMGDVVNLSSRLEGANKEYGTYIMINERTYELSRDQFYAREMDLLRVKGKTVPVKCFHLMGSQDSAKAETIRKVIGIFTDGVNFYREQKWDAAISQFEKVLGIWDDDNPSHMYIRRCKAFQASPPPADWDGVFTMTTK